LLARLQKWVADKASTDQALWVLGMVSFLESALIPFPVEAVSIPVMLANIRCVWLVALIATVTSVVGGMLGYAIGLFLFDTLGMWLLNMYGLLEQFVEVQAEFREWGWTWVMIGGITPVPYKVISIASGVASLSFFTFMAASIISRGIRFAVFALAFWYFGDRLKVMGEKHGGLISAGVILLLIAGFAGMILF
jgi:membrane protein YqaA with SNARE-associated domain